MFGVPAGVPDISNDTAFAKQKPSGEQQPVYGLRLLAIAHKPLFVSIRFSLDWKTLTLFVVSIRFSYDWKTLTLFVVRIRFSLDWKTLTLFVV